MSKRLTRSNQHELRILEYFMPQWLRDVVADDEAIRKYFAWSDRGENPEDIKNQIWDEGRTKKFTYLSALYWSKRNRDLMITSYKEDWGTTCTAVDFMESPRDVAEFVAKSLGKPSIMAFWRSHNAPDEVTNADTEILGPLGDIFGTSV